MTFLTKKLTRGSGRMKIHIFFNN